MKTIGFVILSWNSKKYIEKCLDSIFNLKNFYSSVIIIDNGSSDGTVEILQNYEKDNNDKNIKKKSLKVCYLEKNYGTTKSRNIGIKYILEQSVDYICILDSDTVINDNAVNHLTAVLDSDDKVGIVGPKMYNCSGILQCSGRKFPTLKIKLMKAIPIKKIQKKGEFLEKYDFNDNKKIYDVEYLISACWVMPTKIFNIVGLLDEKIFYAPEDVDYCLRTWKKEYRCCFCPAAEIIHDCQRISKKKLFSKMNLEHIKGLVYFFKKHHYLFNSNNAR